MNGDAYRIVLGVDGERRRPYGEQRVGRRGIAVVRADGRIAPGGALHERVKLKHVVRLAERGDVDGGVGGDVFVVAVSSTPGHQSSS